MSVTTINPTDRRVNALIAAGEAKAAFDIAKADYDEAKALLLKVCPEEGVLLAEGFKANIVIQARKDFDVDAAAELLPEEDFEAVTVRKIDSKAWDVFAAHFSSKIIAKIVISKPTTTLTIKEV